MSAKSTNEVQIEKTFNQPVETVFRAIGEGRLFNNCGATWDKLKVDFRIGGKYVATFTNHDVTVSGKFLEILTNKKVVFTWGDEGSDEGFPRTQVSIELLPEGKKTKLRLLHTGFETKEECDSHEHGWSTGLTDMGTEIEEGKITIARTYPVSREKLYKACSDFKLFMGCVSDVDKSEVDFRVGGKYRLPTEKGETYGKFEEIVPGGKIVFTWEGGCEVKLEKPTRVTLEFDDEEDGKSSLALKHELLPFDQVRRHREGWEFVTGELLSKLK